MAMSKFWQETWDRLDKIEKELKALKKAVNPTESLKETAEKYQEPVKKATKK